MPILRKVGDFSGYLNHFAMNQLTVTSAGTVFDIKFPVAVPLRYVVTSVIASTRFVVSSYSFLGM